MSQRKLIIKELARHAPFTALGTATGIIVLVIIVFSGASREISDTLFYTLHPTHILLSAFVMTSMYRLRGKGSIWQVILIGYTGSIGLGTLSDAIIPYLGGTSLRISMEFHIPFIEAEELPFINIPSWVFINSASALGIALSFWKPTTRLPHAGHILISTWASLFSFTAFGTADWIPLLPFVFLFLFLSVWLPCCFSDIVYPLLFVRKGREAEHNQESRQHEKLPGCRH